MNKIEIIKSRKNYKYVGGKDYYNKTKHVLKTNLF